MTKKLTNAERISALENNITNLTNDVQALSRSVALLVNALNPTVEEAPTTKKSPSKKSTAAKAPTKDKPKPKSTVADTVNMAVGMGAFDQFKDPKTGSYNLDAAAEFFGKMLDYASQARTEVREETPNPISNKPKTKKAASAKVADKPTTRTEAIAQWKAVKGITADKQMAYNEMYNANFTADWAKWTASKQYKAVSGDARKAANKAHAKKLRNKYREAVGLPLEK